MKLPPRAEDQNPMNVVAQTNGEVISFLVDSIGDVLEGELLMVLDAAKSANVSTSEDPVSS